MNRVQNHLVPGVLLLLPLVLAFGCKSASNTDLGEYDASMSVNRAAAADQQPDQYMVDMLVWRQRADGGKAIVSAPQLVVAEGQEAVCEVGSDAEKGIRCVVVVKELNGKKIGTATVECHEDGATVWQKKLQAEAASASD